MPEFASQLEDQWHTAGDNIVLKVQYRGYPEPVVTWSVNVSFAIVNVICCILRFKGQVPISCSMRIVVTADGALTEVFFIQTLSS